MKRVAIALTFAAAAAVAVQAQDVKSETQVKVDNGKTIVYSGCLAKAEEGQAFILENAAPVKDSKTETKVEVNGKTESKTETKSAAPMKYMLVASGPVEFGQMIGHKVEVTAVVVPAGDDKTKIETKTKTEVKGQPDSTTKTTEKIEQGDLPQLHVVALKHLADRCEAH